jgi:hypothetical protein
MKITASCILPAQGAILWIKKLTLRLQREFLGLPRIGAWRGCFPRSSAHVYPPQVVVVTLQPIWGTAVRYEVHTNRDVGRCVALGWAR